jgi:hypothetical protein
MASYIQILKSIKSANIFIFDCGVLNPFKHEGIRFHNIEENDIFLNDTRQNGISRMTFDRKPFEQVDSAKCLLFIMSVIQLSVILLSVKLLNVILLRVILLRVNLLDVTLLNVLLMNVILLSFILLRFILLNVIS